jgi:hypothetical protein
MRNVNYLDGFIYHMAHIDNLPSIFCQKALLSQELLGRRKIISRSIAYDSVQKLRDRIFIWDYAERRCRNLHSYVPFYFSRRSPMLFVQQKAGRQHELVIFKVQRSILEKQGVVFTDGNATNQQLSQTGSQEVYIMPAGINVDYCVREYRPAGPQGSSQLLSDFYGDVKMLNRLDWDGINYLRRIESWDESLRVRSAETLIPDSLAITEISGIAVSTKKMVALVNARIVEYGIEELVPWATYEPALFI